jgi:hypothetical protein
MPKTRMAYERIKRMHEAGDHARCKFGCCPENFAPDENEEFEAAFIKASLELAAKLGRNDPRVAVALDAKALLASDRKFTDYMRGLIDCAAGMDECLMGTTPDAADLIEVSYYRSILDQVGNG